MTNMYTWADLEAFALLVRKHIEDVVDRLQIQLVNSLGPDRGGRTDNEGLCRSLRNDLTVMIRDRCIVGFQFILYDPHGHGIGDCRVYLRASYQPSCIAPDVADPYVTEEHFPSELPAAARVRFAVVVQWSDRFLHELTEVQRGAYMNGLSFHWTTAKDQGWLPYLRLS